MFSLLIPAFNEELSIEHTVRTAHDALTATGEDFAIVVIDDGSTDRTAAIVEGLHLPRVTLLRHPANRGYSASLKLGIRQSKGEVIGITDADGTYPVEDLPTLLADMRATHADMVVGARTKKGAHIPLIRRPAKAVINALARLLTGMKIPDLNSGLRVFSRPLAERFLHLYPQRFSFTITITLGALTNDYLVRYVPIDYRKREGKSTLSAGFNGIGNFLAFFSLIIRMIIYFRPLRFFVWPSLLLTVGGLGVMIYTIATQSNVSDSGLLLFLTGLQVGLFGLVAEAVVRNRAN